MTRSTRFNGLLAFLGVMSLALASPLAADEVTVTVPPGPQAQTTSTAAPALPSFTGNDKIKTSQATDSDGGDQQTTTAPPPPPAPPSPPVEHKTEKKHPAVVKSHTATVPKAKTGKADSASTASDKSKTETKPKSKVVHAVKKKQETKKATASAKAKTLEKGKASEKGKAAETEVLPWEKKPAASDSAKKKPATDSKSEKTAKVKKPKTVAKKKDKPKDGTAATVPVTSGSADKAPWSASPAKSQ